MRVTRVYLILGCFGRNDNGFVTCNSIENKILEVSPSLERIDEFLAYIDFLQLPARPLSDYNAIRRALFKIQDKFYQNIKPIWSERYFRLIENFTLIHKSCGIYLKIIYE